jgi:hypothetical protein
MTPLCHVQLSARFQKNSVLDYLRRCSLLTPLWYAFWCHWHCCHSAVTGTAVSLTPLCNQLCRLSSWIRSHFGKGFNLCIRGPVFAFPRKFFFAFREKSLQKVMKIAKVFAKIFLKNDTGSENAVKNPNSKRQTKFRSWRNAVDQRIRVMFKIKWELY